MTKTLEMVFRNAAGKLVTVRVVDPKDGLTNPEAQAVMNDIITKNIFSTKDGDLTQIVEARVQTRDTVVLL